MVEPVKIRLCLTVERRRKTFMIMSALLAGSGGKAQLWEHRVPPRKPFVVWGHRWNALRDVPQAQLMGTSWWLIDNGYHLPANGGKKGYYSITHRGWAPEVWPGCDRERLPVEFAEWNPDPNGHVLVTLQGDHFGKALGFKKDLWRKQVVKDLQAVTDRQVIVRDKTPGQGLPLEADLERAWALVTHSSKSALLAIRMGVPCIVDKTSCAAPVSSTSLKEIEDPKRASLEEKLEWWASLMAQQFSLDEMRQGLPWESVLRWPR